jgi:acetylornithine deacetylase/succinyl-diaminopimelate desuccinylase-like protein
MAREVSPRPAVDDATIERALAAVSEERVASLLVRMVNTPSPTGRERACAELLAAHLEECGVRVELQAFQAQRANVLASLPQAGEDGVRLMLCGHLDTGGYGDPAEDYPSIGPLGEADVARAFVEDGVVSGLGAFNMKGGVTAAAEALVALAEAQVPLRGDLLLGAVAGESEKAPVQAALRDFHGAAYEGSGVGATWLVQHSRPADAVVICEPSDLWVVNGQPGYLFVKIAIFGRYGSQGSKGPHFGGVSALEVGCRVAQALTAWEPRYREAHRLEAGMGTLYANVTVGSMESGTPAKPTAVPAVCNVYVDLRVGPHRDPRAALAELDAVVREAVQATEGARYELQVFASNVPGALTPLDHPLVQATLAARDRVVGSPQERHPDSELAPGDDGKVFARCGIPYVKVGPGGRPRPGVRRRGRESVEVQQVVQAARLYVLLALDLANRDRAEATAWPAVKTSPRDFA